MNKYLMIYIYAYFLYTSFFVRTYLSYILLKYLFLCILSLYLRHSANENAFLSIFTISYHYTNNFTKSITRIIFRMCFKISIMCEDIIIYNIFYIQRNINEYYIIMILCIMIYVYVIILCLSNHV